MTRDEVLNRLRALASRQTRQSHGRFAIPTKDAMGVAMGVIPGFVAACHIARLMVLSVLLPMMAGR